MVFGSLSGTSVDVLVPVIATTTAPRCISASLREPFGDERPVLGSVVLWLVWWVTPDGEESLFGPDSAVTTLRR